MQEALLEKKIASEGKSKYVNSMFENIADKYDLLNNLMTLGLHNSWKHNAVTKALEKINTCKTALDLCSGTGDLCVILNELSPDTKITYSDNSENMLSAASKKFKSLKINQINLIREDAENISYPEQSFDLVSIGFGLRNLVNQENTIKKINSITKDNGVFVCIDLGHPTNKLWEKIYFTFFYKIVPFLGKIFAKNKEAYTYLPESLKTWYKQDELKEVILNSGFKNCQVINYCGGVVAAHIAVK